MEDGGWRIEDGGLRIDGRGLRIDKLVRSSILNPRSSILDPQPQFSILESGWEAHLEERWCEAPEEVSSTLTPTTIAKWCNWQHARL